MDKFAKKFNKILKFLGYAGIFVGFLGMIFLAFSLIHNLYNLFVTPEAAPGVGLVLPFKAKGVFFVPFFHWIISIFIIALIHEFAHGVIARVHNIKVKSSGFAFLGIIIPIIPAAFVEPDEKELKKRPHKQQLSVFAAGPFGNILLAFAVLGLLYLPLVNAIVEKEGVKITGFIGEGEKFPAESAGIEIGEVVKEINSLPISTTKNFMDLMKEKKPGTSIELVTNKSSYNIILAENPDDKTKGYLGIYVSQSSKIKGFLKEKYGGFLFNTLGWIIGLFYWLIILNLGIGLFNLVPIGPLDGGRMLQLVLHRFFDEKKGNKIWYYVSMFFLMVVLANIGFAFIK